MAEYDDFQEIAHRGGRVMFHIVCDAEDGRHAYEGAKARLTSHGLAPR